MLFETGGMVEVEDGGGGAGDKMHRPRLNEGVRFILGYCFGIFGHRLLCQSME
jgi:hypothetical protein